MKKVITITTSMTVPNNKYIHETTYPELQALLDDGYEITEKIHSISNDVSRFSITLFLEKE